ncbi:MAG: carboxypeptidase regulatory-like domain-containing protein [Nitrospirae bacterium]|nr:carboxypeptidase regulatory-like domain-containing protein [Nitrospirota bacterium]
MKKILTAILFSLMLAGLIGCSGGESASGRTSRVTITIGSGAPTASFKAEKNSFFAKAAGFFKILTPSEAVAAGGIPSNVRKVVITVEAVDMDKIETSIDVVEGQSEITTDIDVPKGSGRHFIVEAKSQSGCALYRGDTTIDVNEDSLDLDMNMDFSVQSNALSGGVKDALTGLPLEGIMVEIYKQGNLKASAATDANGAYSLSSPAGSGYSIQFSKSGYIAATYENVTVQECAITYLETVSLIDAGHAGLGNASGKIVNALDGMIVNGLTVNLRAGINAATGTIVATQTTMDFGGYNYEVNNFNAGNYTAEVSGAGYNTTYFTLIIAGGVVITDQNASITPIIVPGETRIILTWGATPADLDAHLTGPLPGGTRFHMYFYYTGGLNQPNPWPDYVIMDRDNTSGYGPETITIHQQTDGEYRFSVHDFTNSDSSNSNALSNSGAQVKVYRNNYVVATYNVPANQGGTLWTVFEMSGDTITPVNTMSYEANSENIQ